MFIAQMNLHLLKQLQISQPVLLIGQEHYLTNRLSWSNVFVFITTIIKHHLEFDLWETQLILISFGLNYKEIKRTVRKQIQHFNSTSNVALTSIKVPGRPGVSMPSPCCRLSSVRIRCTSGESISRTNQFLQVFRNRQDNQSWSNSYIIN